MGDMADFSMSCFLDRNGNPDKRDTAFYSIKAKGSHVANKNCKRCGATNLAWGTVKNGKYRLHEVGGKLHVC